jgi:hypothetical protein
MTLWRVSMSFATDIRPLFRQRDIAVMRRFDAALL